MGNTEKLMEGHPYSCRPEVLKGEAKAKTEQSNTEKPEGGAHHIGFKFFPLRRGDVI